MSLMVTPGVVVFVAGTSSWRKAEEELPEQAWLIYGFQNYGVTRGGMFPDL